MSGDTNVAEQLQDRVEELAKRACPQGKLFDERDLDEDLEFAPTVVPLR